ncbi:MAG: hypothetical protein A2233_04635 [Candidatus Kerfeldbacteria bacterium RIFOXYA2_FULL_38_24]|uniref:DAGKc domain-containing protein n=1 Tax=Candidatus Kerfeldbacteria bacterium RIFOXYB2_FULL_38_14 TaxID=1798547 RepID=A0A1G2BHS4_9BACT|nr:MAG: hypothetical protein A2319_02445 [Candidatus Kerfeldbacteria bacterium RIFOXYB2_FULL_38_14]OGY88158.1 MAG: hypothetical protein A2233_04635 [Candidatus Kerfeldbacteria bacterium RIFOXYA2_FULL_38_24]OGY89178.1 MAG: hypothetical protein A2458_01110 [Candidatus Kerfeldbacteria bacterium RIFOXYC2_FULL_38_9]
MYFYFYDKITQDKRCTALVSSFETKLVDLGIAGRTEKLSLFKNAAELVEQGVKTGAKTLVAVGDDATFLNLIPLAAKHHLTFGFLPVVPNSRFAKILGLPAGTEACVSLSRRITVTCDLGKINDTYFFGSLTVINNNNLSLRCDQMYSVKSNTPENLIQIMNLGDVFGKNLKKLNNISDGKLEVVITEKTKGGYLKKFKEKKKNSVIFAKSIEAVSPKDQTSTLVADGICTVNTPCTISVVPQALHLIVGKDRLIN